MGLLKLYVLTRVGFTMIKFGIGIAIVSAALSLMETPLQGLNEAVTGLVGGSNSFTQRTTEPAVALTHSVSTTLNRFANSNETTAFINDSASELISTVKNGNYNLNDNGVTANINDDGSLNKSLEALNNIYQTTMNFTGNLITNVYNDFFNKKEAQ